MTEQEINKAIADYLGYDLIGGEWHRGGMLVFTETGARWKPTYCNNLNAMHEAEKVLDDDQGYAYSRHLQHETRSVIIGYAVLHATAVQRAEAFLKTLNLWK